MKKILFLAILFVPLINTGCKKKSDELTVAEVADPNLLTNEKVENALQKCYPNNQIKVIRIREIPSANAAEGEIQITSFNWSDQYGNPGPSYSGPVKITLEKLTTGWQIKDLSFKINPQAILEDPKYFNVNLPL